jgi:2-polyprenyl-3-methyl-5-hydroxy-6-metoxy-1,4-benzoquinol methylase
MSGRRPLHDDVRMAYMTGHSAVELDRLSTQAALLRPTTARLLRAAGVGPGQRVLDVGCGAGDVALLAAGLVGPAGSVTGIDRSPEAIAQARRRAYDAGINGITFVRADLADFAGGRDFDAVVGRHVLFHQADPVAFVRQAARLVRPGGVLAVHEMNVYRWLHCEPRVALIEQIGDWLLTMTRRLMPQADVASRMASVFLAAGLPPPVMFAETVVEAPGTWAVCSWLGELLASRLPQLVQLGIATEAEADVATVESRLRDAVAQAGSQVEMVPQVGAWLRSAVL